MGLGKLRAFLKAYSSSSLAASSAFSATETRKSAQAKNVARVPIILQIDDRTRCSVFMQLRLVLKIKF